MRIMHTTPATGCYAVYVAISEGYTYSVPVVLWAVVEKDDRQEIIGAVLPSEYSNNLQLVEEEDGFWKYIHEDETILDEEARAEIDFIRKLQPDRLTEDFLTYAVRDKVISEALADEIAERVVYPFPSAEQPVYSASAIARHIEQKGLDILADRPAENETVKKLYHQWFPWRRNPEKYAFSTETGEDNGS